MVSRSIAKKCNIEQKSLAGCLFKHKVLGFASRPVRLARSRTPGFHPGNRGSNPLRDAILFCASSVVVEPISGVCWIIARQAMFACVQVADRRFVFLCLVDCHD